LVGRAVIQERIREEGLNHLSINTTNDQSLIIGDVHDGVGEKDDDFIMAALPIHIAAREVDVEEVVRLVQEDPQVVNTIDNDSDKMTPLHYASRANHVEVACYMLWTRGLISTPLILMGKQLCLMHVMRVIWGW